MVGHPPLIFPVAAATRVGAANHHVGLYRVRHQRSSDLALLLASNCLSRNIYHEAKGEPLAGMFAVAHVTMRRAKYKIGNICKVVYAPLQFSWTNQSGISIDRASSSWLLAERVALFVLLFPKWDVTYGATHFHAVYVSPPWKHSYQLTKRIGNHLFYRAKR